MRCVNPLLGAPDQQTVKTSAFIEVVTQHLDATYSLNSYEIIESAVSYCQDFRVTRRLSFSHDRYKLQLKLEHGTFKLNALTIRAQEKEQDS